MIWFHHRLAIWLCWGACALQLLGQETTGVGSITAKASPPTAGILDSKNFFSKQTHTFQRLTKLLQKLDATRDFKIQVVIEPVLISSTPSELAAQLRQAWIRDGDGLVLVFESDSRELGISRDLTSQPGSSESTARMPSHEISAIVARSIESADTRLAAEPYLEAVLVNLVRELDDHLGRRAVPPPAERSIKIMLLILGGLALLGLGAIALGGLLRHSQRATERRFRFPVVDRPERLGAPCGGSATTRRFAPPVLKG